MTNFQHGLKYRKKKDAFGDLEMDDGTKVDEDIIEKLFGL
jgi:hypothetical protein